MQFALGTSSSAHRPVPGYLLLPRSRLPVLVMERLHTSLDDMLEQYPDIPLHVKLSILHDVTKGLVFLHTRNPVIVHRDLTARNVLLDAAMTAKIADLGNSRITNLRPGQLAGTMTMGIPGTLVYMPPEASTDHYGPPLDMFSFGHLCLFTATQVFPGDLLPSTYTDPRKNKVKARTELERRESYMSPLEATLGKTHGLVSLVKGCLENDPRRRPTASQALDRMRDMMAGLRPPFLHMNRFQLEKTLTDKSAEADTQAREIADNRRRLQHLNQGIEELRSKKAELETEAEVAAREKAGLQAVTDLQAREIADNRKRLQDINQAIEELRASKFPDILKCQLPLKWKTTTEMPMGAMVAQAVVIGEKVYIGGGMMAVKKVRGSGERVVGGSTDREEKKRAQLSILECSMTGEGPQWRTIVAPTGGFAMAAVDNQLIIAGGVVPGANVSDHVSVLDSDNKTWTQPFPAMPTVRFMPSAIGYKRWLVVVGGSVTPDDKNLINVVEVLDTSSKQWYTASPLPRPTLRPSLAIIQDTLYTSYVSAEEIPFTKQIFIPTLISNAISCAQASPNNLTQTEWQELPDTLTPFPALTSFHGHLLAVGADDSPSSTIAMYLPHIQQWQKVAELPTPRGGCACCFLPATKQLLVFGGEDENQDHIFTMDICELDTEHN
ncbi:Protein kinase and PP2C-like domain-containing protein [Geodia barretti]|uniref:Protein kinase and PP2C-like domain-containing protein n=1 Tax=Geodia barretti TaxID=519541 RepID=A0AA35SQU9_GEOBA|nr:Protein kinase and PP2C-like domain-containing protein [Geodia barretti]